MDIWFMSDSDSHRGGASLPAAPLSDKQVAVVRKICDNYPDFTKKGNIGSISPVEALINELSLDKPDPEKFERHFYESREPWGAPYWNQLGNDPRSHTEKADRPKRRLLVFYMLFLTICFKNQILTSN